MFDEAINYPDKQYIRQLEGEVAQLKDLVNKMSRWVDPEIKRGPAYDDWVIMKRAYAEYFNWPKCDCIVGWCDKCWMIRYIEPEQ